MLVPDGTLVLIPDPLQPSLLRNRGRTDTLDLELVPRSSWHADQKRGRQRFTGAFPALIDAIEPLIAGGSPLILVSPRDELEQWRQALPSHLRCQLLAEICDEAPFASVGELVRLLQSIPDKRRAPA